MYNNMLLFFIISKLLLRRNFRITYTKQNSHNHMQSAYGYTKEILKLNLISIRKVVVKQYVYRLNDFINIAGISGFPLGIPLWFLNFKYLEIGNLQLLILWLRTYVCVKENCRLTMVFAHAHTLHVERGTFSSFVKSISKTKW